MDEVDQWPTAVEQIDGLYPEFRSICERSGLPLLFEATVAAFVLRSGTTDETWSGLNAGRQTTLLRMAAAATSVIAGFEEVSSRAAFQLTGKQRAAQRDELAKVVYAYPAEILDRWADSTDLIHETCSYVIGLSRVKREAIKEAKKAEATQCAAF